MKKSQAAKYARWSAAAALLLAGLTVGIYLQRGWKRRIERKNAPAAAPQNVERQSSLLTFSKVEQNQKIFTVEASKSIDLRGLNISDLEGVKITIFGKDGSRHDTMETHTCRYAKDTGDIACSGEVTIVLMTSQAWDIAAGQAIAPANMKVQTRGITFNRASGTAKTDEAVHFWFAGGSGDAVGAQYDSAAGTLQLEKNVNLRVQQPPSLAHSKNSAASNHQPVEITGTRMDFSRDAHTINLIGPASAKSGNSRLVASGFFLDLDDSFRARRLTARSSGANLRPEFGIDNTAGSERLSADRLVAYFAPQGWLTHAEAQGNVAGESRQGAEVRTMQAQSAFLDLIPGQNLPKTLVMKGSVGARMTSTGAGSSQALSTASRTLSTGELHLTFAQNRFPHKTNTETRLAKAETVGPGKLELSDPGNSISKPSQIVVQADQLTMQLDDAGLASRLIATGNVHTERASPGSERQTATAQNGSVQLQPRDGWSRIDLADHVHLSEAARSAQADQASFAKAEQTVTLTGHASVRDATTLTTAKKLVLWQDTGEIHGEGGVRSSDLSAAGSSLHLAPVPANISAERLSANSKSGKALYSGNSRLWQGDSVLQADTIELLKKERAVNAVGGVKAVFPQMSSNGKSPTSPAKRPVLWHAQSNRLTYWDQENRARLEQNVTVQSPDERITGDILDLYFSRANDHSPAPIATATAEPVGAQQISRAVATGAVTVQQGERKATAERGEYTATDGKFVMSGGTPTIFDAAEGTTTGRQLTFFLADATIIVDSETGSRTLTKHRVEK